MPGHVPDHRLALGKHAEALAADHLEQRGYQILARNWRRPEGELDLVVGREEICVFVEVRSRTGTERGHPLETVERSRAKLCHRPGLHRYIGLYEFIEETPILNHRGSQLFRACFSAA